MISVVLYEGPDWQAFRPLTWTRPTWALRCGDGTVLERAERVFRCTASVMGRRELIEISSVAGSRLPHEGGPALFLDGRFLVSPGAWIDEALGADGDVILEDHSGQVVGARLLDPPGDLEARLSEGESIATMAGDAARRLHAEGRLLEHLWDPMVANGEEIARDHALLAPTGSGIPDLGPGVHIAGSAIRWSEGASCQGGAFLDSRSGPILIGPDVRIGAGTIIEGPASIGGGTQLYAARLTGEVSIGPVSKVGGEIECTVIQGYSNKAHDGFLGHAHLGSWVNLGAMTTNSDLKNTYGNVQVNQGAGIVDTGQMKVGCFLGDHVKTSIGTLIYTGSVVGPGSVLFAGTPVSGYIPSFVWQAGHPLPVSFPRFLKVARAVMARRGIELGAAEEALLRNLHAADSEGRATYLESHRRGRS